MAEDSALAEFKHGITLLRNGHSAKALEYLRHAAELEQQNPYYLSFLGVSVARAQRKWAAAVELCEKAVALRRSEAQLFLNLAEVYVSAGRRDDAIAVLDRGLIYFRLDPRIRRARANLGRRCPLLLPFLERGHFLNRSLGRLRHRLSGRQGKPEN
ncbi:MAG: tetratricopeptide repeat protein [Acidobacteriia bacterium]|nr:tetratricopeptide repeat protein [Terriglobia bacterium]